MVEVVRCDQILDRVEKWGQENSLKNWMYWVYYVYKNNTFNTASLLILGPSSWTWIFMKTLFSSSCAKMIWSLWFNNCEKHLQFHITAASQIRNVKIIHRRDITIRGIKSDKINWKLYIQSITLKLIIVIKASNFLYFPFP